MALGHNRRRNDPDDFDAHLHRRKTDEEVVLHLHSRVADCEESIQKLLESQKVITENLQRLAENTGRLANILEAWNNVQGFWWTLKLLSTVAKALIPIAAFGAVVWAFIKTGQWINSR